MSLRVVCSECRKEISPGRARTDWDLNYNDGHFGIGPVHGYVGMFNGGGKCRVDYPLAHLCETCVREKLPSVYKLLKDDGATDDER